MLLHSSFITLYQLFLLSRMQLLPKKKRVKSTRRETITKIDAVEEVVVSRVVVAEIAIGAETSEGVTNEVETLMTNSQIANLESLVTRMRMLNQDVEEVEIVVKDMIEESALTEAREVSAESVNPVARW
jgi:hypothetical protein